MVIQDWLSGEQFKTDSMLSEDVGTSVELLPPERQAREQQPWGYFLRWVGRWWWWRASRRPRRGQSARSWAPSCSTRSTHARPSSRPSSRRTRACTSTGTADQPPFPRLSSFHGILVVLKLQACCNACYIICLFYWSYTFISAYLALQELCLLHHWCSTWLMLDFSSASDSSLLICVV